MTSVRQALELRGSNLWPPRAIENKVALSTEEERHDAQHSPAGPPAACARIGARDDCVARARGRSVRAISMGEREGAERRGIFRDDHPKTIWRCRFWLFRSGSGCR